MKTSFIFGTALLISSVAAMAQGPGNRPLLDFRKKSVDESTKSKAIDAAKSVVKQVPDELKDKAKELLTAPETADMRQKALQAAQAVMQGATGTAATPEPAAASPGIAVVETPPPSPAGPQPRPLQALDLDEAPKATKSQILITAQKSAFFDANEGYGIYTGNVKARHPQMYIECEELEIWMRKQEGAALKPKAASPVTKDADILAPPKKSTDESPIEKADARGPMVTIEKVAEDGELQIGRCKHLIHDGKTGITTLYEWPQVQVGNQLHKATEPGCVMIIDKKGKLTTHGGNETIILHGDDATPKSRSGMTSAPQ